MINLTCGFPFSRPVMQGGFFLPMVYYIKIYYETCSYNNSRCYFICPMVHYLTSFMQTSVVIFECIYFPISGPIL